MPLIQTAQNVDLSYAHIYVAGHQYNISSDERTTPISNPALDEHTQHLHSATGPREFPEMNARFDAKEGQPPRAIFAGFDCNRERTRCLEGTRTNILHQIFRWIGIMSARDDESAAPDDPCIFWINGSAGTGKTTISYTVAEECRKCGVLGASFFCSRDDSACSDPGLIFTTIAYQIGIFSPPFRDEISRVMKSHPDIGYASISYQIEQLLVNPLLSLAGSIPPCVVVIDALDECRDSGTPSMILSALSRYVPQLAPLKFLVTSRPENHITTAFRDRDLAPSTRRLILHEVHLDVVQGDITSYLSSKLALTKDVYNFRREWPAVEDVRKLSRLSHGLFIFAATSVKFIEDRNYCDPQGQLAHLLSAPPESDDGSPHAHLYRLYTQVLNGAFPNISSRLSDRLKEIMGSIVLLREPLSPFALAHLLGLELTTVQATLARLHSVIIVPEDDTQAIRLLHPSFFDFITNPLRCRNPKFVVNSQIQHAFLARSCLQVMKSLRRDICDIGNPFFLNSEVNDLSVRIKTSIPPHVQYACRHWASHLAQATFSNDLVNLIEEFCAMKLLNWLEVCGLLGELRSALLDLNTIQQAVLTSGWEMSRALQLLHDCERFTLEFFEVINSCSLQTYRSALLFTPLKTAIRSVYGESLDQSIKIYNAPDETWNPCMRVMEGHSDAIYSVAFSPDSTRIVSGSRDNTVRLWDAVSGAHLVTLSGHSEPVNSVVFSPDGTCIVSASDDDTLRLWDAVSGAHLVTLTGHSASVESVAFSSDGTRIVSGSYDTTIRLWDVVSGAHLVTLSGHSGQVNSVAFSPDDTRIVSGSDDNTLRLWDAVSGAHLVTPRGHSGWVTSVAFSPDGTRIVSESGDGTLQLWDAAGCAHLGTLSEHSNSITFSPDGTRLVSGYENNTVRLRDAVSGAHIATLSGHSNLVDSVAFSPDGTRIVSGSWDKTLRLWDAIQVATSSRHSAWVYSVTFSPDGTHIVSGSADNTLQLWNAASGTRVATLSGHSRAVVSVAFSPDGTRLVSGSDDSTLRLWDAASCAHLTTLNGHSGSVKSVSFSPDGTRIVSGSDDNTLRLWDAVSSIHLLTLSGHSGPVVSVAFSPDGTRIASGSWDMTLRIWDAVSGVHLVVLRGHSGWIESVAFSPDGTRIVFGSNDNTLWLWDAISNVLLCTMQGRPIYVPSLARSLSSSMTSFSSQDAIPSHPTCPIFSYLTDDGWIYSITLNRRIYWIPPQFRPRALDVTKDSVAFSTDDGRVVILRFNSMS